MDNSIKEQAYIYGIKIQDELVYIGKTYRDINKRLEEHALKNMHNADLEAAMKANQYEFVILYESHNVISNEELCQIERAFIENIKPKYNILGVSKPYTLYATKNTYNNGIKRQYKALCQQEIEFLMDFNPFLLDVLSGPVRHLIAYFYENKIITQPTAQAFKEAFGDPNLITDETWMQHGNKGFCVKGSVIYGKQGQRYLTYQELIKETKIPEEDKYYCHSLYVFLWEDNLAKILADLYEQYLDCAQINMDESYFILDTICKMDHIKDKYKNLDTRMSCIVRPRVCTYEDRLLIGPMQSHLLD